MDNNEDDPLLQLALALSMQGQESEGGSGAVTEPHQAAMDVDDPDLLKALEMSMREDFAQGSTPPQTGGSSETIDKSPKEEEPVPTISAQEMASTLSEVWGRTQSQSSAGASNVGVSEQAVSEAVQALRRGKTNSTPPDETPRPATKPRVAESHFWVDNGMDWLLPAPAIEQGDFEKHRADILSALQKIAGEQVDVRSPISVEAAASSACRIAYGRKLTGRIQKLSNMQGQCANLMGNSSGSVKLFLASFERQLGKKALELLKKDEDDIFFEGGQVKAEIQAGLANGSISFSFLDAVVAAWETPADKEACEEIVQAAFKTVKYDFKENSSLGPHLYRLDQLTRSKYLLHALTSILLREVKQLESQKLSSSERFEELSIMRPLLSVSTIVEAKGFAGKVNSPVEEIFVSLRGYPSSRGEVESNQSYMRKMLDDAHSAAHEIMMRVVKCKHPRGPQIGREAVLTWLSAVATMAETRTKGGERQSLLKSGGTSSDAYTLGALSVALRFCRPFLKGEEKFLQRLDARFYENEKHRFGGKIRDRALAGQNNASTSQKGEKWFSPDRDVSEAPHFVAECFFLAQRLIRVALLPAVHRYSNMYEALLKRNKRPKDGPRKPSLDEFLLQDSSTTQLLDPVFAGDAVKFVALQALWLHRLISKGNMNAFKVIPESVVRDLGSWMIFVIQQGSALLLGDINVSLFVECLVELIENKDVVKSPLVWSKVVELLLTMLSPQLHSRNAKLGQTATRPGEAALVAAVLGTGAAQERLVPALMRLYSEADHVVGLDVDRDAFDKFHMRNCIDLILEELWKDDVCRASLTNVAQKELENVDEGGVFAQYIGSVLNDLMYLLKDCFDRLADIHNIEESMANEAEWAKLSAVDRKTKTDFYEGQQHTCRGFMRLSVTTLRLLNLLSADKAVCRAFLKQPLSGRAAYGVLQFLELLVGPGCTKLTVKNPEQYNYHPQKLLAGVCEFMLQLGRNPEFQVVLAEEQDFDAIGFKILTQTNEQLVSNHQYQLSTALDALMLGIKSIKEKRASSRMQVDDSSISALQSRHVFPDSEPADLDTKYVDQLRPLAVSDFDASAPNAYNSAYSGFAQESGNMNPKGMKRLGRELRDLHTKALLPIYPASSIIVRHDSDRLDKVRAMITGPEGTPYGYGCFVFDVFFPPDYPNVPPLMSLETTGHGRARFNPNLYADGKVCLSLLGTWHGVAAHEKWDPTRSTLFQILISIQGMIFVEDPYFNEPNVDMMRDTTEGHMASSSYNAELQLNTLRWAMIDQIRHPRKGFEEVTWLHFKLMRHRIIKQCHSWVEQCSKAQVALQQRMGSAVDELHSLLDGL
ncbi:hypothetical protein BSKO_13893 [Bryopsis sp. KO-2023]|nr:hypothetical protein BSKO_13893 [Bryopsis sp. KO-2023]